MYLHDGSESYTMSLMPNFPIWMQTQLPLAVFKTLDWCIVVAYLAGMVLIGHLMGKKKSDDVGYFLGGRSSPTWAVVLSIIATSLSAATFLGAPEEAFKGDLTYLILNVGNLLGVTLVAVIFIPKFYAAGTVTIYGFLQQRFGEPARIATSIVFLLGRLIASGARLFMAAAPVCMLLFHSDNPSNLPSKTELIWAIVLIGAIGMAYTVSGGIRAVIWTDVAQIIIVAGAAMLCIGILLHRIPSSTSSIYHALSQPGTGIGNGSKLHWYDGSFDLTKNYTIWVAIFSTSFMMAGAYGCDHDLAQRMLTAKSSLRGSSSALLAQVLGMLVSGMFMLIGLLLYVYHRRPDLMNGNVVPFPDLPGAGKQVYAHFLMTLPSGFSGIAMAGLAAVAQGSLDSAINAMAGSAVADVYWPIQRARGKTIPETSIAPRLAVLLMGLLLIGFAILCVQIYDENSNTLLSFAVSILSFAYTGMLGVFLTALLTKRGNNTSVIAALIAGVVITFLMQDKIMQYWSTLLFHREFKISNMWAMTIGTPISFLICVMGKKKTV